MAWMKKPETTNHLHEAEPFLSSEMLVS